MSRIYEFPLVGSQFKAEEIAAIMDDFEEPGKLAPTGLHLGGTKYMVIQGEPGAVIRGKKVMFWYSVLLLICELSGSLQLNARGLDDFITSFYSYIRRHSCSNCSKYVLC